MPVLKVKVKHNGKVHDDILLRTETPPVAFKQSIYEKTGIPVDRMKVMVKGGMLKVCLCPFSTSCAVAVVILRGMGYSFES